MARTKAITLSAADKVQLEQFVNSGQALAREVKHAHVLLKLGSGWSHAQIAQAFELSQRSIIRIKQPFQQEGLVAALKDKPRSGAPKKIDGDVCAVTVAIACSEAPTGHQRWTLRLIAQRLIELEVVEYISHVSVGDILKKTNLNPGKSKNGVSPRSVPNS